MRILLVAPRTDLVYADAEVQDILTSGLDVEPLIGQVTKIDVTRALRRKFDGLWLVTHGDEDGVLLSDEVLSISAITQLVRERVGLVFLNTCKSVGAAQMLQNETGATVVCSVQDVPDAAAYHTASLFASALADSNDPREAYDRSRPGGNRTYLFLAGKKKWAA